MFVTSEHHPILTRLLLWGAGTGLRLAANGYGAFGIDFEGHGKSDGLRAMLKSMDPVVDDCLAHFKTIHGEEPAPHFLNTGCGWFNFRVSFLTGMHNLSARSMIGGR